MSRPVAEIVRDLRLLLDELEAHAVAPVRARRRGPRREPQKLALVPTDLQRARARRILLGKGVIR